MKHMYTLNILFTGSSVPTSSSFLLFSPESVSGVGIAEDFLWICG